MKPVKDPKGRFTVSFPTDWNVTAMEFSTKSLSGTTKGLFDGSSTMLMARPAIDGDRFPVPILMLMTMTMPKEVSPNLLDELGKVRPSTQPRYQEIWDRYDMRVVQSGTAKIAGHLGSYAYVTMGPRGLGSVFPEEGMYAVYALFGIGRMGVFSVGMTVNDPARIRADFATISRILETVRANTEASTSIPLLLRIP